MEVIFTELLNLLFSLVINFYDCSKFVSKQLFSNNTKNRGSTNFQSDLLSKMDNIDFQETKFIEPDIFSIYFPENDFPSCNKII